MFDFYLPCVRHFSVTKNCYYWQPLKIYTSRSSCIRFLKSYTCKSFEIPDFGIICISQDSVFGVSFKEVFYGKD